MKHCRHHNNFKLISLTFVHLKANQSSKVLCENSYSYKCTKTFVKKDNVIRGSKKNAAIRYVYLKSIFVPHLRKSSHRCCNGTILIQTAYCWVLTKSMYGNDAFTKSCHSQAHPEVHIKIGKLLELSEAEHHMSSLHLQEACLCSPCRRLGCRRLRIQHLDSSS